MSEFNGSFLGVRESSSATPEFVEEYAVKRANEKTIEKGSSQFFITFNAKNNSFGLAFADQLKADLNLDKSYYYLVQGNDPGSNSGTNSNLIYPSNTLFPSENERQNWIDQFNADIQSLLNSGLTQLTSKQDLIESDLDTLTGLKTDELIDFIQSEKDKAKSEITEYSELKKSEITDHANSELNRINTSERQSIEQLNQEVNLLKDKVSELESNSNQSNGISLEEVELLITQKLSEQVNTNSGVTLQQVNEIVSEKISEFLSTSGLNTNDPAMIDPMEIMP